MRQLVECETPKIAMGYVRQINAGPLILEALQAAIGEVLVPITMPNPYISKKSIISKYYY